MSPRRMRVGGAAPIAGDCVTTWDRSQAVVVWVRQYRDSNPAPCMPMQKQGHDTPAPPPIRSDFGEKARAAPRLGKVSISRICSGAVMSEGVVDFEGDAIRLYARAMERRQLIVDEWERLDRPVVSVGSRK